jgi:hypothetical protein
MSNDIRPQAAAAASSNEVSRAGRLPADDRAYLQRLAKDTWDSLDWMVHPVSGLPYDNNRRELKNTSVSNIGLYAAALAGAVEMGFISRQEGAERLARLMDSLEKFVHWNGLTQSWNNVETLRPSPDDTWISILDSGNLAGGLLVAKHAFDKEAGERIGRYLDAMDWSKFYDEEKNEFYGGYNMATGQMNYDWKQTFLGSDSRLVSLIAIGTGKLPPKHWDALSREMEERYGLRYYMPGWQGGGLFMQFISGIFIDDRGTPLGAAAARFAYAQIFHAKAIQSPVWGWSASDSPSDGYLGWQALKDRVVTPHASALPLSWFPKECVANLRKLEALGLRADLVADGKSRAFGFRDSIDLSTSRVTGTILTLDQGMLFLSIVNALKDGALWKHAAKDPIVVRGRALVRDYAAENVDVPGFWRELDALRAKSPQVRVETLNAARDYPADSPFRVRVHLAADGGAEGEYALWWRVMEEKSGRYAQRGKTTARWPQTTPTAAELGPLPVGVYMIQVALVKGDDILSEDALTFNVVGNPGARTLEDAPAPAPLTPLSWDDERAQWTPRALDLKVWERNLNKDAEAGLREMRDGADEAVEFRFAFKSGEWAELVRPEPGDFARLKRLAFQYRYDGDPVKLEVKLEDGDGSVFGFATELRPSNDWSLVRVDTERLKYLWGGNGELDLSRVSKLMIAVAGRAGSQGALVLKDLEAFEGPAR